MSDFVEIHEFSTGIVPELLPDGGWISRGFTGSYMNMTLPRVPNNVERAIANRLFEATESSESNQPAIIGRVVPATDSEPVEWAIVAIASRARDDAGRPLTVVRYLLTDNPDGLRKLTQWIDQSYKKAGVYPVFNPRIKKNEGHPSKAPIDPVRNPYLTSVHDFDIEQFGETYLLQPSQAINPLQLHELTTTIPGSIPDAWAFCPGNLENPGSFKLIYPSSPNSYSLIRNILNASPRSAPVLYDEQKLKSAIKNIISSKKSNPSAANNISEHINQLDAQNWNDLFDSQGATNAKRKNIYSPQLIRLITLQSLIQKNSAISFLSWIMPTDKKNSPEYLKESIQFQKTFYQVLSDNNRKLLERNLYKGWEEVFEGLTNRQVSTDQVLWLADMPAWQGALGILIGLIYDKLLNLATYHKSNYLTDDDSYSLSSPIWDEIKGNLHPRGRHHRSPKYKQLALFFLEILKSKPYISEDTNVLAAVFFQISENKVPSKLYKSLKIVRDKSSISFRSNKLGIYLKRDVRLIERCLLNVKQGVRNILLILKKSLNLLVYPIKLLTNLFFRYRNIFLTISLIAITLLLALAGALYVFLGSPLSKKISGSEAINEIAKQINDSYPNNERKKLKNQMILFHLCSNNFIIRLKDNDLKCYFLKKEQLAQYKVKKKEIDEYISDTDKFDELKESINIVNTSFEKFPKGWSEDNSKSNDPNFQEKLYLQMSKHSISEPEGSQGEEVNSTPAQGSSDSNDMVDPLKDISQQCKENIIVSILNLASKNNENSLSGADFLDLNVREIEAEQDSKKIVDLIYFTHFLQSQIFNDPESSEKNINGIMDKKTIEKILSLNNENENLNCET